MAAFDDGTPLDAAALQDLERRLVEIRASIPKVGATPAAANSPGNLENKTVSASQILGGLHTGVTLVPGKATPFTINFKTTLQSNPKSVVITPVRTADIPSVFSFAIDSKTLGPSGVSGNAYLNSSAKSSFTIGFYWMVICH
jgi:hypothetical protein